MGISKYIVFEGPDLAGKTTVAKEIKAWLASEHDTDAVYAQQPGSTALGSHLRHIIKHEERIKIGKETEAMVFVLDQMAFVENIALAAIDSGKWILSDRSNFISGLVYQVLNGVEASRLEGFHAVIPTPKIDIIFLLHAPMEKIASRARNRDKKWDRYESDYSFMVRVFAAYDRLLDEHRDRLAKVASSCILIDAARDTSVVLEEIKEHLSKLL